MRISNITVDINNSKDAQDAIRAMVSHTRRAILAGDHDAEARVEIKLSPKTSLSVINNSHAFNDAWEGAATLEIAVLQNGRLIEDEHGGNDIGIINGIDYHKFIQALDSMKTYNLTKARLIWSLFWLEDSRYPYWDAEAYEKYANRNYKILIDAIKR